MFYCVAMAVLMVLDDCLQKDLMFEILIATWVSLYGC